MSKPHFNDDGRPVMLFGKVYKWTVQGGRYVVAKWTKEDRAR